MRFSWILVTSVLVHSLCCHVAWGDDGGAGASLNHPGAAFISLQYDWDLDPILGDVMKLYVYSFPETDYSNPVFIATNMDHDNTERDFDSDVAPSVDDLDLIEVKVFCSKSLKRLVTDVPVEFDWCLEEDSYYNYGLDILDFRKIWGDEHKTSLAEILPSYSTVSFYPTDCGDEGKSFWLEARRPCGGTVSANMRLSCAEAHTFFLKAYEVDQDLAALNHDFETMQEIDELLPGGLLAYHPSDPGFNATEYANRNHTLWLGNVGKKTGNVELSVQFLGEGRVEIYREDPTSSAPFIFEDPEDPENTETLSWTADVGTLVPDPFECYLEHVWVIPTHLSSTDNDVILSWTSGGYTDEIRLTVVPVGIDIDVDSDNDDGRGTPEQDGHEDSIEVDDVTVIPNVSVRGKIIPANHNDNDEDGVVDYLDGFDHVTGDPDPLPEDNSNVDEEDFYPVVLKLVGDVGDITENTWIKFTYPCAAPNAEEPTSGGLRLWAIPSPTATRDGNPAWDGRPEFEAGNFVAPYCYQPSEIGMSDGSEVFYVEGIEAGEYTIEVGIDMDQGSFFDPDYKDEVKVTVAGIDVLSVPEYLFASATYWTPIKFEVKPGTLSLSAEPFAALKAVLHYDHPDGTWHEATISGLESYVKRVGETGNIFECYINPANYDSITIPDKHFSSNAYFTLEATLDGYGGLTIESQALEPLAKISGVFADETVFAVDTIDNAAGPWTDVPCQTVAPEKRRYTEVTPMLCEPAPGLGNVFYTSDRSGVFPDNRAYWDEPLTPMYYKVRWDGPAEGPWPLFRDPVIEYTDTSVRASLREPSDFWGFHLGVYQAEVVGLRHGWFAYISYPGRDVAGIPAKVMDLSITVVNNVYVAGPTATVSTSVSGTQGQTADLLGTSLGLGWALGGLLAVPPVGTAFGMSASVYTIVGPLVSSAFGASAVLYEAGSNTADPADSKTAHTRVLYQAFRVPPTADTLEKLGRNNAISYDIVSQDNNGGAVSGTFGVSELLPTVPVGSCVGMYYDLAAKVVLESHDSYTLGDPVDETTFTAEASYEIEEGFEVGQVKAAHAQ